ncbi:MAG: acyltransferase [Shewanella psychromarinicola]|uniref:Acyltransferase n=1 Tax=Shewanella psychromarinicola TaxID=2487742 RepID=A0A3N4E005_9GAMM|nr:MULTISPECIES: acyltransferase [Shewanella]AZG33865.1 acyltransferase [Shewanella psychromarinicola]MCL1080849.1 acyltransferase [Shewanella psychromarinicola]PKG78903.1 acyltransferase [Shewanella sp. Actino-trap-3]RPA31499.1 acyltransferase [Shewanella psychromarinicola]|tara:strand:+ start:18778 stop:19674 length:897 start_codon:yes stop_codon:yes gene_type:complete
MSPLSKIKGSIAFLCYLFNTIFWTIPILMFSIVKLIPIGIFQKVCSYILDNCATAWISTNTIIEDIFHPMRIHVTGDQSFSEKEWYMVIANHQSWVDILILQRVFNRNIPFLKFFLKQELIFVPVLGLAWWALDFPFMRRYSTAQLRKNPKLKGKDIEITRKACEKFKTKPVSIMNFVEGTRFSVAKHDKQNSAFQHLLKPKAGGMAFALSAMGEHINKLVNVTIYYPDIVPTYWQYICGELSDVRVDIKITDIPKNMRGDYLKDREFKIEFQEQLNQLWVEKDQQLQQFITDAKPKV